MIVLHLIDRRQAGGQPPDGDRRQELRASLRWAGAAAGVMFVTGLMTRILITMAGTATSFDGTVSALFIYAAVNSALVGFLVVFCVSEVLFYKIRNLSQRAQDQRAQRK